MNMHEQNKRPSLLSIITWSVLGKQNVQAEKVYYLCTCTSKRKTMRVKTQFSQVWKIKTRIPVQKLLPFRRSRKLNAFSLQIFGCGFPDSLKLSYTKILILLVNKSFLFGNSVAVIIYKATFSFGNGNRKFGKLTDNWMIVSGCEWSRQPQLNWEILVCSGFNSQFLIFEETFVLRSIYARDTQSLIRNICCFRAVDHVHPMSFYLVTSRDSRPARGINARINNKEISGIIH